MFVISYFFRCRPVHPHVEFHLLQLELHQHSSKCTAWKKSRGLTPSRHLKSSNTSMLYFLRNPWYTSFTKFHPTTLDNLVLHSGSNTLFGFWVNQDPNPWHCVALKNSTSSSTYLDNGMASPLALFEINACGDHQPLSLLLVPAGA